MSIQIEVNGKKLEAFEGETILTALKGMVSEFLLCVI